MALPWVRFDTNMASHDKIVLLSLDPSPKRYQAMACYMFSIQWSGGHGTDGRIPAGALPFIHGTAATARLLVKYGLWIEATAAWEIKNFAEYQALDQVAGEARKGMKRGAAKGNCLRWHGPNCNCWKVAADALA